MNKKVISTLLLLFGSLSNPLYAETPSFKIKGTVEGFVPMNVEAKKALKSVVSPSYKSVRLQHIILSPSAKSYLAAAVVKTENEPARLLAHASSLPPAVSLGMNQVPVLDQGQHGTCVTFADTGALDAALNRMDYISQLCNLSLGLSLAEEDSEYPSGWDGSFNEIVLNQIERYGIISKRYQLESGCGGVTQYPLRDEHNIGKKMTLADFQRHSEYVLKEGDWANTLSVYDAFSNRFQPTKVLNDVKTSLNKGNRSVIAFLVDTNQHDVGAYGSYKTYGDSWVITPKIIENAQAGKIDAGHAIIITGFDDNATIKGPKNTIHRGVLTLRNSWGPKAGNHGDWYMSYDYFKAFIGEVQEIKSKK